MKKKQEAVGSGLPCVRCGTELIYAGKFKFHEGTRWGFAGELFELFVHREIFDVCKCPNCCKVEFYDVKMKSNK